MSRDRDVVGRPAIRGRQAYMAASLADNLVVITTQPFGQVVTGKITRKFQAEMTSSLTM